MRLPIFPTLLVAFSIAAMIGLGVWQLRRADWKEAMVAEMRAAQTRAPVDLADTVPPMMGRATIVCAIVGQPEIRAGLNRAGEPGYRYLFPCRPAEPGAMGTISLAIDAGWSRSPRLAVDASGGDRRFTGIFYRNGGGAAVLTADRPLAPLQASRPPAPEDVPNNHLLYAIQWFAFAAAAAAIYLLALRRRQQGDS